MSVRLTPISEKKLRIDNNLKLRPIWSVLENSSIEKYSKNIVNVSLKKASDDNWYQTLAEILERSTQNRSKVSSIFCRFWNLQKISDWKLGRKTSNGGFHLLLRCTTYSICRSYESDRYNSLKKFVLSFWNLFKRHFSSTMGELHKTDFVIQKPEKKSLKLTN